MDIPSLFMIPSAVSSGKVHSVFPNSTDADFDFNRDSDATRVNSEGLIERVGYYGSEKIVNGDFSSASGWSTSNASISNGVATLTGVPSQESNITRSDANGANGKTYKLTYTIISNNLIGTGSLFAGLITINEIIFKTNIPMTVGTHTVVGNSAGTGANFSLHISSGFTGGELVLDNISVKEITGDRARLNYEIEGGLVNTKPSLLLEPQSTNLITYSEDFSQSYWVKSGASVTSGFVSPDGTNNAYKLVEDSANSRHFINSTEFSTPDTVYSSSVFVKPNGRNKIALRENAQTGNYASFNLSNGTVIATNGVSASIELMFNGWYRINYQITSGASIILGFELLSDSYTSGDPYLNPYQGDGSSGILIYGAQVESQSYATSYIPTNGSTQTRAAETCNGAGTSSIFESSEGILYAEIAALANNADTLRWINLNNGATTNRVAFYYRTDENQLTYLVSSGTTQVFSTITLSSASSFIKIAAKWKANDFALWVDGVKVVTDTSGNSPVGLNQLSFDNGAGGSNFYGKLRDIRVYNTKEMTDSEVDILLTKITS